MAETCVNGGIVEGSSFPAPMLIIITGAIGIAFAFVLLGQVAAVKLDVTSVQGSPSTKDSKLQNTRLLELYNAITLGASSFLTAEYKLCTLFIVVVFPCMWFAVGTLSAVSFVVGAVTSMISGLLGMKVAVFSNARCTVGACSPTVGWTHSFNTAFKAGGVMGFSLTGIALLSIYCLMVVLKMFVAEGKEGTLELMEALAEDDPHNPGTIADNVGDNVGDVAGMGSDLFGSFGEATCAALLVGAASPEIRSAWSYVMFPLYISAVGIIVCMVVSFVATNIWTVKKESDVETVLKVQLVLTSVFVTAGLYLLCTNYLPDHITIGDKTGITQMGCFLCCCCGLWGGCLIGFITEYYTSSTYSPVRDVARSTETGAATNIIYGLALGYKSAIAPVMIIAVIIYIAFGCAGMYGVALS